MKKNAIYIMFMALTIFALTACSQSRKNEIIYRFQQKNPVYNVDSLKNHLLDTQGLEMLAMYPDSDLIIIHYDRFQTHIDIIEKHFEECDFNYELLKKKALKEVR